METIEDIFDHPSIKKIKLTARIPIKTTDCASCSKFVPKCIICGEKTR